MEDPIRNADAFSGELSAILMEASSGGSMPEAQRALAERIFNLLDTLTHSAPPCAHDEHPGWMAIVGDDDVSVLEPSGLRIMATQRNGQYFCVMVTPETGPHWNITRPMATGGLLSLGSGAPTQPYQSEHEAPTEMEISIVDEFQVLSTHRFLNSGESINQLDVHSQLQSRVQKIQDLLDQAADENTDVPPAPGISDTTPGGTALGGVDDAAAGHASDGGGLDPGLGAAMAGVGRIAAGAAIGAAAGLAMAALHRGGQTKEPPKDSPGQPAPVPETPASTTPPVHDASAPLYPGSTVEGPLQPAWRIRVLAGPEAGNLFQLKLQSSLGRGNDNEIQILDPEISRNHLRFDVRDDAVVVTDLGSSRGTLVDGKKIEHPTPLRAQQIVEAGRSRFILESTAGRAVPAAAAPAAPEAEKPIWFFADREGQQGPVTETVLRQRLATNLPRETLVWHSKLDGWKPAHTLGLCPAPAPKVSPAPAAASGQAEWFYMEKGQRKGPVTESALRQQLTSGLPRDAMVWKSSFDVWKPAHVAGLCEPAAAPAPAPARPSTQEPPIWYFMDKGARQGPVAESILRQRLASGLPPDTQVWNAKLDGWKPAHALGLCAAAPQAPAAEPEWYFMDHGVRQGPVAEALLRQRLAHGLPPDTQVWNPKLDNWKPAHTLGLCPSGAAPAVSPAPPSGAAPAVGETRKCPKCGRVLAAQHRFCAGCGTKVG